MPNDHPQNYILGKFYAGLDTWGRVLLDYLAHGTFCSASPSYASYVLMNLLGNPGKTKEEVEVEELKGYFNEIVKNLGNVVEKLPNRKNMDLACSSTSALVRKMNVKFPMLAEKIFSLEDHVKTKEKSLRDVHNKISSMSNYLGHTKDVIKTPYVWKNDETTKVEELKNA